MGLFNKFPYTDLNSINLDYTLNKLNDLYERGEALYTQLQTWQAETTEELAGWKADVEAGLASWKTATEASIDNKIQLLTAAINAAFSDLETQLEAHIAEIETTAVNAASAASASATAAAGSASDAADSATAAAGSASDAEDTAESLSESLNQIATNTSDITDLKSATTQLDNRTSTGQCVYTKGQIIAACETISRHTLYQNVNIYVGTTTFSQISTATSNGAYALKVNVAGAEKITYPVFKSTGYFGCFMFDKNNVVVWSYDEKTADTGTLKTVNVPDNADYFLLSIPTTLYSLTWSITIEYPQANKIKSSMDARFGTKYTKAQAIQAFPQISANKLYQNLNVVIGTTTFDQISTSTSNGAFALRIDLTGVNIVTYPLFKSSGYFGSFILDSDNVVIWAYDEKLADTGTLKTINVPEGAAYMLLSISASLNAMDWSVATLASSELYEALSKTAQSVTPFQDVNRNMCLAGIKTDILTNKIPYHRGFLFHKLQNNDGSLWYGTSFDDIAEIGRVSFDPTLMRFAISPKDGRIIATQRDARNGIWIWDGTTETHLNSFETNPMGWLYNSGVDFIVDGNNIEHCIFAEYNGTPSTSLTLNVWRGTYPYTSASDWEIVMSQVSGNTDIDHFHMVRRDPWSNVLYLTSGDSDASSKWWYSTDYGENWTLLVSGATSGWSDQVCRTINFIFTADYIYWATDHGENKHALYKVERDSTTHIIDLTTKAKITDLPGNRATNSICYVESPKGLFMYDRVDNVPSSEYGQPVTMKFWDFTTETLIDIVTLKLTSNTWGGSRGKCYINYTNSKQPMPAMGFSIDTPCIFDIVCDDPSNIGTIAYEVGSKTIHTIDY